VDEVAIAITERADIIVDFSQFAPGTQIIMRNDGGNAGLGTIMRFTVMDTPPIPPPALDPSLFPARPALPTDAPLRTKTMHNLVDADGNAERSVDGLLFSSPVSEFALVGSTEQWDVLNIGGGPHQIHLHLIEFQLVSRQNLDSAAYRAEWHRRNGFRPRTRPIVVDPTPFLVGDPIPPLPYETGWKDTLRANSNQVMRLRARWAPQETPTGGVDPGENQFPIDPTTGPGYLWHCHVLGHEDNDMMRRLQLVNAWAAGTSYSVGTVIAHNFINYRVRVAHTSQASQPPNTRFDLWERVNNNDGSWQPQIIYAVGDRVLHNGLLFRALSVHQAQAGQPPPSSLWEALPNTACGQLAQFCADDTGSQLGAECLATGQVGDEAACLGSIEDCIPVCEPVELTPCSGLCNDPVTFAVPDGQNLQSGPLGTGPTCHETMSQLLSGSGSSFVAPRQLTVNGVVMPLNGNWPMPLPKQRNMGYCIQTTGGNQPWAAFTAF
jgi:hypothetical protein